MINKKTIPVAVLLLLAIASGLVIAGASRGSQYQVPAGNVVMATGAVHDADASDQVVPAAPALSAATGQVLFSEDFSNSTLKAWHNLPDSAGPWAVTGSGALRQAGSDSDGNFSDDDSVLVTNDSSFANGLVEAQVFPTAGEQVGVAFRSSDAGYYRVWLAANLPNSAPKARLQKVVNGTVQDIAINSTWHGYTYSQWQTVQVNTIGNHITVSIDGTQLFDTTDSSLSSGSVGVWTVADRAAEFDNIRVQAAVVGR